MVLLYKHIVGVKWLRRWADGMFGIPPCGRKTQTNLDGKTTVARTALAA